MELCKRWRGCFELFLSFLYTNTISQPFPSILIRIRLIERNAMTHVNRQIADQWYFFPRGTIHVIQTVWSFWVGSHSHFLDRLGQIALLSGIFGSIFSFVFETWRQASSWWYFTQRLKWLWINDAWKILAFFMVVRTINKWYGAMVVFSDEPCQ